ncbi:MAG TPA: hypothetical protein VN903_39000, partial [Polyangia bacterium]|nr:hypothetical protein [Polyangia bacterium]
MRPLLRPTLLVTLAASVLASGEAWAQFTDGGTTSNGFAPEDFFVRAQDIQGHTLSDFDVARYFNKARCDCSQNVFVYVALSQTGLAKQATLTTEGNIEVWLGTTCSDINLRGARCVPLAKTSVSAFLHDLAGRLYVPTDARNMASQPNLGTGFDGGAGGGFPNPDCTMTGEQASQTIWVLWDKDGDGAPETSATQTVDFDVRPPPAPSGVSVEGGNQALIVHWTGINAASYPDLVGYQILCKRGADLQVFANSTFEPGFQTCTSPTPKPIPDAGPISIDPNFDGGVEALNPLFACSPLLSPTTSSFRVKILQNAITYGVAVVAIDKSGNASVPDVFYGAPILTKSFYDV